MKCETPAFASGSSREPAPIQKPSETERTLGDALGDQALAGVELREDVLLHGRPMVILAPMEGAVAARAVPDPNRWWALALLCSAYFMVILDVSIVNVALPSIQEDLHFSPGDLQWVLSAYALTFGGFLLLGGRTADLLGRRRVFMVGVALFTAASLVCGLSTSEGMLIGARAVQGLGAAILSPAALSIITTTFEEGSERNKALGIWGAMGGSGAAVGVLMGGILTKCARLGVDLLRQRADRHRRARWSPGRSCARAGPSQGRAPLRRRRRGADHERALAPRLRAHPGEPERLGVGDDDRHPRRVGRAPRRVHRGRAPLQAPLVPLGIFARLRTLTGANVVSFLVGG